MSESKWRLVLSSDELAARFALTAKLDPAFAASERKWWEGRNAEQLRALLCGAWEANDADTYQLARSYLARIVS